MTLKDIQSGRLTSLIVGIIVGFVSVWVANNIWWMLPAYFIFTGNWIGAIASGLSMLFFGVTGFPTTIIALLIVLFVYFLFLRFQVRLGWYLAGALGYMFLSGIIAFLLSSWIIKLLFGG
jgi:hypothetical protein